MFRKNFLSCFLCISLALMILPGAAEGSLEEADLSYAVSLDEASCICTPAPAPSPGKKANTGVVTSSVVPFLASAARGAVNLRVAAGTKAALLAVLPVGDTVRVIGQTTGADDKVWYRVLYGTMTGYIRYDQVQVLCGTAEFGGSTDPVGLCEGQTNMSAVNVRLGMSVSTSKVRQLRRGQKFTILALAHDYLGTPWYYVCIPSGAIGYIRGEYVTVVSGVVAETIYQAAAVTDMNSYIGYETAWDQPYGQPYGQPEDAAEESTAAEDHGEELIYLRWMNAHLSDFLEAGFSYQGYSLYDLDGDGIREALVSCDAGSMNRWEIYTCVENEVVDLGQVISKGYYLSSEGAGLLLINIHSDSQTQYTRVEKVGNSLVVMYALLRTADENWNYTWSYNQTPITEDSLRILLKDFPDDVLQNMGLFRGLQQLPGSSPETDGTRNLVDEGDNG